MPGLRYPLPASGNFDMKLMAQRRDFDCGVASLAMLYRLKYEDVYHVAISVVPPSKIRRVGIQGYELETIARRFKRPLRRLHYRRVDLENHIGILSINYAYQKVGHWVVLHQGTVLDPSDAEVWDAEDYVRQRGTRHGGLWMEA